VPLKLDAGDRKILLAAFAIFVITSVIAIAVGPSGQSSSGYPSIYSTESDGAKAAYILLSQTGYQVEHWRQPPSKLLERGANTVILIIQPTQNATLEDRQRLRKYVEAGGRVVAVGPTAALVLPRSAMMPSVPHFAWQEYPALLPDGVTREAPAIVMAPAAFWNLHDSASKVDFGDSKDGVVASYKYGKGEVIWWASPDPLTNSGITHKSNLQLFLNSLGSPSSRTVLWDDYFHTGEVTLFETLWASPLKWAGLQLCLLAIAVLLTYSRRHGPLRVLPQSAPMATLEFVETLGGLYESAKAGELPVQIAYERFRHLLFRKLGISTSATPAEVSRRVESRLAELAPQCEPLLRECESAQYQDDFKESESLRIVRTLEQFSERLKLKS